MRSVLMEHRDPSERMKLSEAIETIRGFAEEERFQERMREMKEAEEMSGFEFGDSVAPKLSKPTMGKHPCHGEDEVAGAVGSTEESRGGKPSSCCVSLSGSSRERLA
jgi:hypothetical protein